MATAAGVIAPIGDTLTTEWSTCEKHGRYEGYKAFGRGPVCPKCAQEGIEANWQARAEERAAGAAATRWQRAGIPPLYQTADLSETASKAGMVAEQWLRQPYRGNLLILGPVGTGKTYIAAGLARRLCDANVAVRFITHANLLREIRATWGTKDRSEEDVLRGYATVDILILDDVGAARGGENDVLRLAEIIDDRVTHRRATIVTSNLLHPEIAASLGQRTYDRLQGGALQITLLGKSRRQVSV